MRLSAAPVLTFAGVTVAVLGFDLAASLATRLWHVPYIDFQLPDFVLFVAIGYVLTRRLSFGPAALAIAAAALVQQTAGRGLATALRAEGVQPGTAIPFLVLETLAVAGFTTFWGFIGMALAFVVPHRR